MTQDERIVCHRLADTLHLAASALGHSHERAVRARSPFSREGVSQARTFRCFAPTDSMLRELSWLTMAATMMAREAKILDDSAVTAHDCA